MDSQFTLYDDTMEQFLKALEFSVPEPNKNTWFNHVIIFMDTMGLGTNHWIDRIIRILKDNIGIIDPIRWRRVLKVSYCY